MNKHMYKILLLLFAFLHGYSQQNPSLGKIFDRYGKVHNQEDLMVSTPNGAMKKSPLGQLLLDFFFQLIF